MKEPLNVWCVSATGLHPGGLINLSGHPRVTVSSVGENDGLGKVVVVIQDEAGARYQGSVPVEGHGTNVKFEPM